MTPNPHFRRLIFRGANVHTAEWARDRSIEEISAKLAEDLLAEAKLVAAHLEDTLRAVEATGHEAVGYRTMITITQED